jgi:hypothetical protein
MSYKKRNPIAKDLENELFRQRVREPKRQYLLNKLHEEDADEDLFEYFGIGKAPKE